MIQFVIGGNWKMQMGIAKSKETAKEMVDALSSFNKTEIFIAPSYTSLVDLGQIFRDSNIKLAAQNMSEFDIGAYTGEISPDWLIEAGVEYVLLGHSERRRIFKESNERINLKVKKALEKGLKPVLCIGETAQERQEGLKEKVNAEQLQLSLKDITAEQMKKIVIAYEPVWAINSRGLNPVGEIKAATPEQAQEMHEFIRKWLIDTYGADVGSKVPLQYGGSVKPSNCEELFKIPDINGGLIGGASLKPKDLSEIVKTAESLMD